MSEQVFLAVDLGASGGRTMAGRFDGSRLTLEEVARFENGPIVAAGTMYWDLLALWKHVQASLKAAAVRFPGQIKSVGVDTWGVDFAFLGPGDELLSNPVHYRDGRTRGMMDLAFAEVGREFIFSQTGLQFMPFNTLYQWMALRHRGSSLLGLARTFLMMPDLFHWLLSGEKANEFTNATTTQFFNPATHAWSTELMQRLDLPTRSLGPIIEPGTALGPLRDDVAAETGLHGVTVVAPGTHDTASAVMAVPASSPPFERPDWCYLSSGTWSLLGAEVVRPVLTDECRRYNFTNEGGVGGTIRLLKNIAGLWLWQECRRKWVEAGQSSPWDELTRLASEAPPLQSIIDPDDPAFLSPADMPQAIRDYCQRTGQTPPADRGAVLRTAADGLALKYRHVLDLLGKLTGSRPATLHIVGGGTQNRLLCQAAADSCNVRVVAGPVEATAIGNLMMQAVAAGSVGSIREAREIIRRSFPVEEFEPRHTDPWNAAYDRLQSLLPASAS
jgi:rhamnulokinase